MKRLISMFIAIVISCVIAVNPVFSTSLEDEAEPGFIYSIKDDGTAEITEWYVNEYNIYVPFEVDGYVVTSIGDFAFYGCDQLGMVHIPYSVTEIGACAFLSCTNMNSIVISDAIVSIGELAFGCFFDEETGDAYRVEEFTLYGYNEGVAKEYANLLSFEYKDVTELLDYSIYEEEATINWCDPRITKIDIPDQIDGYPVTKIQSHAFENYYYLESVTLPESLKEIAVAAFSGCVFLKEIVIPDSVEIIGIKAFANCVSLTTAKLPKSLTKIGDSAFLNCLSLADIEFHENLTYIESRAFWGCFSLLEVTLPKNLERLGEAVFGNTVNLKNIYVDPENIHYYSEDGILFEPITWANGNKTLVLVQFPCGSEITDYVIPYDVTTIDAYAFSYCQNLQYVVITNNVNQIKSFAFSCSDSLVEVVHPASAWAIGSANYRDCPNLTIYAEDSQSMQKLIENEEAEPGTENKAEFKVLDKPSFNIFRLKRFVLGINSGYQTLDDEDAGADVLDLVNAQRASYLQ